VRTSILRPGGTSIAVVAAIGLLGCASPPDRPPAVLEDQYRLSSNHLFHYRPPVGWLEQPAPENAPEIRLWLMSPDHLRSIQIREVRMDSSAAALLKQRGPSSLVQLIYRMESETPGIESSELIVTGEAERTFWSYSSRDQGGVKYEASLFLTEGRLFECRSVDTRGEIVPEMHSEFLAGLRW